MIGRFGHGSGGVPIVRRAAVGVVLGGVLDGLFEVVVAGRNPSDELVEPVWFIFLADVLNKRFGLCFNP